MTDWLLRRWYSDEPPPRMLLPLTHLFRGVAESRRRRQQGEVPALAVPVIVVGNISVGGTGKTPFVIWLVEHLRQWGWRPGVISRGYGAHAPHYPFHVDRNTDPEQGGDEPVLIAQRTGVPVAVAPDRVAAALSLMSGFGIDILIADDGLQHYRLPRQLEFCVIDGARGLGNGALIPAGPLREPAARLNEVDLVVVNGPGFDGGAGSVRFDLHIDRAISLSGDRQQRLSECGGSPVHAIAGIGNPERFFVALESAGLTVHRHVFADHHHYRHADFDFGDRQPLLMTEKDAVKCRALALDRAWFVPASATLSALHEQRVREFCDALKPPIPSVI